MDRARAKTAFQLNPDQSIKHALGENDLLASRKADIQMTDGSMRRVTLFFRAQPHELAKLQREGSADSSQVTADRLKKLLLKQGIHFIKVEQIFHHIRVHTHSTDKKEQQIKQQDKGQPVSQPQSFAQMATKKMEDGWTRTFAIPDIPMGLVDSAFIKAMNKGQMLRVDAQMKESASKRKPEDAAASAASRASGTTTTTLTAHSSNSATHTTTVPAPPGGMPPLPPTPTASPAFNAPLSINRIDNS